MSQSGSDVVLGHQGHVSDSCAIGHWETRVAHGGRDDAGHNGHGIGMDSVHLNLHGLCLPLGHPMGVLDGGLGMDPLHHMLHLSVLGDIGGVMDSCRKRHHVVA